jgi:hypothetical protein
MRAARQSEPVIAEDRAAEQLQIVIAKLNGIESGQQRIETGQAELRAGQAELRVGQGELRELIRRDAPDQSNNQKNVGGRPDKWDWFAFVLEVARAERFEFEGGGIPSRDALRRHMHAWVSKNWPDGGPDDRVLRGKLAQICAVLNLK